MVADMVYSAVEAIIAFLEGRVLDVVAAILVLILGLLFAFAVRLMMRRNLMHRVPQYIYRPLEGAVFYGLLFLAGVAALMPLGINLSALLVAGGFAGIVVGMAAQNTLGNMIAGMMLIMEQPLRVGDPVTVAGISGIVVNISVFSTQIRTWEGTIVRIPNNRVFSELITNYVKVRARRVELSIGIHYKSSIEDAREALLKLMQSHPFCLVSPAPEVFVEDYAGSAVVLKARCWAPPQAWFATKIDLATRAKKALEDAGVVIPYPQRDVHIVTPPGELRVKLLRDGVNGEGTTGKSEGRGSSGGVRGQPIHAPEAEYTSVEEGGEG